MIKKYLLFFTPMCPKCPKIKEFMEDKQLEKEWLDAATPEGLEKAREFKISNVPTVIFLDENGKEVSRATTIEEVKRVIENRTLSDI
ncbi:hypothetical protein GOV06_01545 [Candidatus Woesearchaeota archaeon]|nr:hypothetical protein [Candidatus Woesearchaeota archaeon]